MGIEEGDEGQGFPALSKRGMKKEVGCQCRGGNEVLTWTSSSMTFQGFGAKGIFV